MTDSPVTTFGVTRAVLDPEKPHLMWVLIQSGHETPGDYVARLWYTLDESNPQDWRNSGRALAHFDCREIEGSPEDEQFTTIVTGLKANGCEFGLPFHLGANMISERPDETQMTFFVEVCHEVDKEDEAANAELVESFTKAMEEDSLPESEPSDDEDGRYSQLSGKIKVVGGACTDEWHKGEQTTICPTCDEPPF
jgi:hypothetical protein